MTRTAGAPQEKQVKQLAAWPEPKNEDELTSFLAFVNYLRTWLDPEWLDHERVLRPFRKKGVDFRSLWHGPGGVKYRNAFLAIRKALAEGAILHHPDFQAAANPEESGRPFEIFIDASDYGWAACLCQRAEPHGPPARGRHHREGVL